MAPRKAKTEAKLPKNVKKVVIYADDELSSSDEAIKVNVVKKDKKKLKETKDAQTAVVVPSKKRKRAAESEEVEDEDDMDGDIKPIIKKKIKDTKGTAKEVKSHTPSNKKRVKEENDETDDEAGSDEDIDIEAPVSKKTTLASSSLSWSLGSCRNGMRFLKIEPYKGVNYVNIREFYLSQDGELKPGSKGISLTMDQFKRLRKQWNEIIAAVDAA